MTALELRLIGYAVALLVLLGGAGYTGYRLTATHYQAVMARDVAAQAQVLAQAQAATIAAQTAQQQAAAQAETQYADLTARNSDLARQLADSVRRYAAVHRGDVPPPGPAPTEPAPTSAGTSSNPGADRLSELTAAAATACVNDADALAALQSWAKSVAAL